MTFCPDFRVIVFVAFAGLGAAAVAVAARNEKILILKLKINKLFIVPGFNQCVFEVANIYLEHCL